MNKYLTILFSLLTFCAFAQHVKKDTVIVIQKEPSNSKSNIDQEYISYLKEINSQSQIRYENAVSYYNSYINWIAAFAGLASLLLLIFGAASIYEYSKIKALKNKAHLIISEFEKTIEVENDKLKQFVVSNTVNRINKSSVDVLLSLGKYDLASVHMKKIQPSVIDSDDFIRDFNFAKAQISYFNGCFEEAEKSIKDVKDLSDFNFNELKGAIFLARYYQTNNREYIDKSTNYFYTAVEKAESNFDKKRTKFNLLECLNIIEKFEGVISLYVEAESIVLANERINSSQLKELQKNSRIELSWAYWKTNNTNSFEVFHSLLNDQETISLTAKDYLIKEFWMEEEEAETYLIQYNTFLSNQS